MDTSLKSFMSLINTRTRRVKYKGLRAVSGKIVILMEVETLNNYTSQELTFNTHAEALDYLSNILNFIRYEND